MKTYWIDVPGLRLGTMAMPRAEDWLEDELTRLRDDGVLTLVSCLERHEEAELGLDAEGRTWERLGGAFVSCPVPDRGVPGSTATLAALAEDLHQSATTHGVVVHCRAGIGRATLVAVCVLEVHGLSVESALRRIESARGRPVPDTPAQVAWLAGFAGWRALQRSPLFEL